MDNLMTQALAYMTEELNMIETLLGENKGASDHIQNRMDCLKARSENLQS
jgi:hypothetical protein